MNWLYLILCVAALATLRIIIEANRHKARRPAPALSALGDDIHRHLLLGPSNEP